MNNSRRVKIYPKLIKCRTCLGLSELYSSSNITTEYVLGKTIKEILLLFMPQMVKSPLVGDFICSKCAKQVRNFAGLIEGCIRIEQFLIEESIKAQRQIVKHETHGESNDGYTDLSSFSVPPLEIGFNSEFQTIAPPISMKHLLDSTNVSEINIDDFIIDSIAIDKFIVPELDTDEDFLIATRNNMTFDCPFCDVKVGTAFLLIEHLCENHVIKTPFKCEKCSKEFNKRSQYTEHMKRFKKSSNCDLKKCRYCPELLTDLVYEEHILSHKDIVCDQCGKSFPNKQRFKTHYAAHQNDEKEADTPKSEEASLLCPICGKLLSKPHGLKQHLKTHGQRSRDYICHKCPKTFLTAYSLKIHLTTSHVEKKYTCPLCNVKVKTRAALVNHHNLKHSQSYSHVCKICGRGFSRGDYFRRHMACHTSSGSLKKHPGRKRYNYSVKKESKPAKCKYCSKVFKNVYLLRSHLLFHVKSIRYKCKFCDLTFADSSTKYRHEKRHADPNFDLSCKVCWKRMPTKEELELHLAKHEDSSKYECEVCKSLFARRYLLNHHMVSEHYQDDDIENEKDTVLTDALEEFLL